MKKKFLKSTVLGLIMVFMVAPQAFALDIIIDDYGTVRFYDGYVLGKQDSTSTNRPSETTNDGSYRNNQASPTTAKYNSPPIKTLNSSARQRIELKSDSMGKPTVGITASDKGPLINPLPSDNKAAFKKSENIDSRTVNLSYPATLKSKMTESERAEYFESRYSQRPEVQKLDEEERQEIIEKRKEKYEAYSQNLKEQRQERVEERVEIRNKFSEEGQEIYEIISRNAKARLSGADFSYDQETGEVLLTTPSGQEHILQHLPDQAIERMEEQGLFIDTDQEVEIETTDDGYVRYKAQGKKPKKFLGFFNREIETEVVLDDLTGETTETEVVPDGLFSRMLYNMSF